MEQTIIFIVLSGIVLTIYKIFNGQIQNNYDEPNQCPLLDDSIDVKNRDIMHNIHQLHDETYNKNEYIKLMVPLMLRRLNARTTPDMFVLTMKIIICDLVKGEDSFTNKKIDSNYLIGDPEQGINGFDIMWLATRIYGQQFHNEVSKFFS